MVWLCFDCFCCVFDWFWFDLLYEVKCRGDVIEKRWKRGGGMVKRGVKWANLVNFCWTILDQFGQFLTILDQIWLIYRTQFWYQTLPTFHDSDVIVIGKEIGVMLVWRGMGLCGMGMMEGWTGVDVGVFFLCCDDFIIVMVCCDGLLLRCVFHFEWLLLPLIVVMIWCDWRCGVVNGDELSWLSPPNHVEPAPPMQLPGDPLARDQG